MNSNAAKFTFFYLLSLLTLVIGVVAVGTTIFQIINKFIEAAGEAYSGMYSASALRFAIASLLPAGVVYFLSVFKINKSLNKGELDPEAGMRKWLSYLVMLVAAVVMMGYFISVFYSFLDGELTTKFALKAVTVLGLAGLVFSYYFYDLRREIRPAGDKVVKGFGVVGIGLAFLVFGAGMAIMESPMMVRNERLDSETVNNVIAIKEAINLYYYREEKLPDNLEELVQDDNLYLSAESVKNPATGERIEYIKGEEEKYEICTTFLLSSEEVNNRSRYYPINQFEYEAGRSCFSLKVSETGKPLRLFD